LKKLKSTLLYLLPSLTGALLPLISLPVFTRILTLEEYGALALCQAYAIFINGISNFGISLGYERDYFENRDEKEGSLLYTTISFILCTYIIFGVLTYLFGEQISQILTSQSKYANLLFVTYLATGMTGLKSFYLIHFKNNEDVKKFVWYTLDESIVAFALSMILVVYFRVGVSGIAIAQLSASGLVFVLLTRYFLKNIPFSMNMSLLKKSLSMSLPLTPRIFFGIIGNQFDKYILGVLASVELVGIYSIAQRISGIILIFMTAIQNVWSPGVYKMMFDKSKDGNHLIGLYLIPFFYISIGSGLLVSLFSEEIVFLLAPIEYQGASKIVIILAILYCSYFFGKQNQLIYKKKTYLISFITLVGITLNVSINIFFINLWGLMGIAWGSLLSGLISGILAFIISQKHYRINWNFKIIGLISLVYLLSSLILLLMLFINVSYPFRLLSKIIFIFIYFYLGVWTNIITREKYKVIKHAILIRLKQLFIS
jgi:O-antigen/teichoic acid export membrane protein